MYKIVITGPIGVGKTTLSRRISRYLQNRFGNKFIFIPEYIDDPKTTLLSHEMLRMYLSKDPEEHLSDLGFQSWIQCYYIRQATRLDIDDTKILLFERSMSDSIAIFCNLANARGNIDDQNFLMMFMNCINIDRKNNIPNYFIKNFEFTVIDNGPGQDAYGEIIKIIEDDVARGVTNRVIGLQASYETCYDRIVERSRVSEVDANGEAAYTMEYMKHHCEMYTKLYELIRSDKKELSLLDLAMLR